MRSFWKSCRYLSEVGLGALNDPAHVRVDVVVLEVLEHVVVLLALDDEVPLPAPPVGVSDSGEWAKGRLG